MGTRFIATEESAAPDAYKQMLVDSSIDDIVLTSAFTGLPTSMLAPSLRAAGVTLEAVTAAETAQSAAQVFSTAGAPPAARRWRDLWSAGQCVSSVDAVLPVSTLVERTRREFEDTAAAARLSRWINRPRTPP